VFGIGKPSPDQFSNILIPSFDIKKYITAFLTNPLLPKFLSIKTDSVTINK